MDVANQMKRARADKERLQPGCRRGIGDARRKKGAALAGPNSSAASVRYC
jgi:hypothetical protein